MVPLGCHKGGGRSPSSSSNLSPLAPPFTLDKSYHKQHNPNPPVNFTEQPYGPRFDHPRTVWTPSINPPFGPNFTENRSKDGNFSPSDVPGFPGSQPNNNTSLSARLVPLNSAGNGYDGFPYGQYSNSVQTSLVEAKPYYTPYVVADDHDVVARSEPSYDLLSNFGAGRLSGSSQLDDARVVPGVEYTPQWSGLWNGLNDVEQGNWLDLGGNFGSKDCRTSDSFTYQKCVKKGSDASGNHYNFRAGTLPVERFGSYVGTSIKSANCFDCFGGENNFGSTSREDRKSFKEPNPGATKISSVGVSALGFTSACNENLHLQDAFLQGSLPKYSGLYERPVDSQDMRANCADSYGFDSTSTMRSSPANMTKVTLGGFSSPQDALPSITVNAMNNEAIDKVEKSSDFLPYHPFGLNCQVSSYTGNADSLFARSPSTKMEDNVNKKQGNDDCANQLLKTKSVSPIPHLSVTDCLKIRSDAAETFYSMEDNINKRQDKDDCFNQLLKTKSVSPIPHLSVTDCLKIRSDTAETFYSMENSSDGPDILNPAEDSPCWKGAPASRFSPFEDAKVVTPGVVLENLESCFNSIAEKHKNSPIGHESTDTIRVLGEVNEKTSSKMPSDANVVSREYNGSCSVKQMLHSVKLYDGNCFQSLDKKCELDLGTGNDFSFSNDLEVASSSKSSQSLPINSEGHEVVPAEKLASTVVATLPELKGKCADASSSDGLPCAPTSAGDQLILSPSGNVAASKVGQLSGMVANSEVDISVLINAIKNLSEVLMSRCSNSHEAPTELDHAAVKHIICNLNSCLVKESGQVSQTEKDQDPQRLECSKQAQMARNVMTTRTDQHDPHYLEGLKHDIFHNRNEGLLDSPFLKDNAEIVRDAETIQAIKGVLEMNFPSKEMQPETVLYKNLWLEAEAALCATAVRSRFNRMKIGMEKREYRQTNEEENIPISNASDVNKVAEPPHEATNSLNPSKDSYPTDLESSVIARFRALRSVVEDSKSTKSVESHIPTFACPSVSLQGQANDVEASVMARFKTLKARADNSDPINSSMNAEDGKSPSKENFGPPSPYNSFLDSYFSSITTHKDDPAASVMSRFNILKTRIQQSESLDMDTQELPRQVDGPTLTSFSSVEDRSGLQPKGGNMKDCLAASMSSNPGNNTCKVNVLRDELLEGWYDCSEPGWEHVVKDGSPKQN